MCGITGFVDFERALAEDEVRNRIVAMCDRLRHRGPDDAGFFHDPATGTALGHRRLSIIDLSSEGRQPMTSASGRYTIVYNGEVYNFRELRRELEKSGHRFRSHSDTAAMLAAFEERGVRAAVETFNGMFAFAVLDGKEKTLTICRDRLGIKPLYYGWTGRTLIFASELKPFLANPSFSPGIDRAAVAAYVNSGYIPAPYSIYRNVWKLPQGTLLEFDLTRQNPPSDFSPFAVESATDGRTAPVRYWSAEKAYTRGLAAPFRGGEDDAADRLEELLSDAVALRMVADVPVGAFLSGGIDSSLVVALMQKSSPRPIRTFTIGFDVEVYNEAPFAERVAAHVGTDHTTFMLNADKLLEVVPGLAVLYDEPFADSSQIPTYMVSKLLRENVTVALSGDGGDETFCGYERTFRTREIFDKLSPLPLGLRRAAARLMRLAGLDFYTALFRVMQRVLPSGMRSRSPGDALERLANVLTAKSPEDAYVNIMSLWRRTDEIVPDAHAPRNPYLHAADMAGTFERRMMYLDLTNYMVDDVLVKVDRASMGVGLEARVPLLDYRVVEFAFTLPQEMLVRNGVGKRILRKVLSRHVPEEFFDRPKKGFAVPIDYWLRGPLGGWARDLLEPGKLRREGFFNPRAVARLLDEHLGGRRSHKHRLWALLMFEEWLKEYGA